MPLYLVDYIGTGTRADPWRPRGSAQPGWSAIKLGLAREGARALCWLPMAEPALAARQIAEAPTELVAVSTRQRIDSDLGVASNPRGVTLRDYLADLLIVPPGGKWNPLQPARGRVEAWLGGTRWVDVPVLAGGAGAGYADGFEGTENPLSGGGRWDNGWSAWGTLQKLNGRVRAVATSTDSAARLATPALSADQFAEAVALDNANGAALGNSRGAWAMVRCQSANAAGYGFGVSPGTSHRNLQETDGSLGFTDLFDDSSIPVPNAMRMRLVALGSTLICTFDGVHFHTTTDATLATGQPALQVYPSGDTASMEADDFLAGDLDGVRAVVGGFPKPTMRRLGTLEAR